MTDFWKTDTAAIVKAMKATGNQPGIIQQWKEHMAEWAATESSPDAAGVKAWLPHWQVRPFYTARELAPLWPVLAIAIGHTPRMAPVLKSANRLANELKFAGLPILGSYYTTSTVPHEYFIVERLHFWREQQLTQADFERVYQEITDAQR